MFPFIIIKVLLLKITDEIFSILLYYYLSVFHVWPISSVSLRPPKVVSIGLFWVFFMHFLYNGVYLQPSTLSLPPMHFERFSVFSFVSHTKICKQCSSPSFAVEKHSNFHKVNKLHWRKNNFLRAGTSQWRLLYERADG